MYYKVYCKPPVLLEIRHSYDVLNRDVMIVYRLDDFVVG